MIKKIADFEKQNGSTYAVVSDRLDNWKECECCRTQTECYKVKSMADIEYDLCHDCLYTINYEEC